MRDCIGFDFNYFHVQFKASHELPQNDKCLNFLIFNCDKLTAAHEDLNSGVEPRLTEATEKPSQSRSSELHICFNREILKKKKRKQNPLITLETTRYLSVPLKKIETSVEVICF